MWGSLLALALLLTVNPLRLGVILLVLSRPRPIKTLLAYWCAALLAALFYLLVPLIVLHSTPASDSFAKGVAGSDPNPVVQHAITGVGVFLLVVAAVMAVRSFARSPSGGGPLPDRPGAAGTTTTTLDPSTLPFLSRLLRPATEVPPQD